MLPGLPDPKPIPLPQVGTGGDTGLRDKSALLDYLMK